MVIDVRVFLLVSMGAAALALLTRPYRRLALGVGFAGLLGCVVAGLLLSESAEANLLGGRLASSPFLRWFLVVGALAGLAACLVALVTRWQPDLPAATMAAIGGGALALSIDALPIALLAATAAGALGLISLATRRVGPLDRPVMLAYLRGLVAAGTIAVVAAAWLVGPSGPLVFDTLAGGAAALAMSLALVLRFGAVPLHAATARVVRAALPLGIPLLLAWLPVLVFLVALTWSHRVLLGQPVELGTVRVLVALVGAGSLLVGGMGTLGRPPDSDDLQHVISYGIVQDAGLFLLAFAAFDASVWEAGRVWSLYFVVSKVGLTAWMAALVAVRGTALIRGLEGWARRSPLLAVGLLGALGAGLGFPGLDSWDARAAIIQSAADRPLRWIAYAGWALAYLPFIRVLWVGLRAEGPPLAAPARLRLRFPPDPPARDVPGLARYAYGTARLSRLAIAVVLAVVVGLGGVYLVAAPLGLSEAAAILPEPDLPPASPGP